MDHKNYIEALFVCHFSHHPLRVTARTATILCYLPVASVGGKVLRQHAANKTFALPGREYAPKATPTHGHGSDVFSSKLYLTDRQRTFRSACCLRRAAAAHPEVPEKVSPFTPCRGKEHPKMYVRLLGGRNVE